MKPLRVLSLFDGISCGQVALERAGIPVEVYYSSEIDKYAMQITQYNYPNTIQLGDVNDINFDELKGKIDLIFGGSPCQDLSLNGKRAGLSGERSGLFYKFVEALEVIQPKYFLLENNVGMPQEAYEEISRLMGCYPIEINSAVLSAQNRRRFYWTNIRLKSFGLIKQKKCAIPYPEDKGIILNSILTSGIGIGVENKGSRITAIQDKADCLLARNYKGYANQRMTAALEPDENGKYKVENGTLFADDLTFPVDLPNGKYTVRRLTPLEYERLQTLDDDYTRYGRDGEQIVDISNTQRYKAIGNGWTVDVIAYLFSHIKELNMEEVC